MIVTCPECDRHFKVPDTAAGRHVPCPDCQCIVTVPRRTKASAADTSDSKSAGKAKRRSNAATASGVDPRILIGAAGAGGILVIGLVIVLARGFGGGEPAQADIADGKNEGRNPVSKITATTVVFTEPLAGVPGPEAKTAFPRPEPVPVAAAPEPKFADGATPAPAGDRTDLVATTPRPPESWRPLSKPPAPVKGLIGAYNVPNTPPMFGDAHVSFVSGREPYPDPKLIEKLRWDSKLRKKDASAQLQALSEQRRKGTHWYRYDLRTGKYDGEPIPLAPSAVDDVDFNSTATPMAMSRDGNRLALRHPTETSRVDIYEADGSRVLTFTPYAPDVPVEWISWSSSGRLLTLAGGKLTGWTVPEGKATFEVDGNYHGPIQQIRGHAWLAATAGEHIDLLDAETGACLGRCALSGSDYDLSNVTAMAIAPGGTALFYHALHKQPDWGKVGVVFAWNLTTGEALPPTISEFPPFGFSVIDEHRLLLGGACDAKTGVVYARYMVPPIKSYDWFPMPPRYGTPGAADDRFWTWGPEPGAEDSHRFMLRVIEYPGVDTGPTSKQIFTKETPLTVEVDMGEKARSEAFGKTVLKRLQGQGFTIGKGGWTLRATSEVKNSETNLTMKGWGGKVNVPEVAVHFKLYSPEGDLAHSTGTTLQLGTGSKYFSGQRQVSQKGIEITLEFTWEFPDRNPRDAIIEELLGNLGTGGAGSDLRLPAPIGKFQGKYDLLPVSANTVFAPAPPPGN